MSQINVATIENIKLRDRIPIAIDFFHEIPKKSYFFSYDEKSYCVVVVVVRRSSRRRVVVARSPSTTKIKKCAFKLKGEQI